MTTILVLSSDDFQHCKCSNSRLCNSTLCKPTTNSPDCFCLGLSSCCFYPLKEIKYTRQHTTLMSCLSPSCWASRQQVCLPLLLHPLHFCIQWCTPPYPSVRRGCGPLFLRLHHFPTLLILHLKSSSVLVVLANLQLHCWADYSNPIHPTPLFDELRLPQGTNEPIGFKTSWYKVHSAVGPNSRYLQLAEFPQDRHRFWWAQWYSKNVSL